MYMMQSKFRFSVLPQLNGRIHSYQMLFSGHDLHLRLSRWYTSNLLPLDLHYRRTHTHTLKKYVQTQECTAFFHQFCLGASKSSRSHLFTIPWMEIPIHFKKHKMRNELETRYKMNTINIFSPLRLIGNLGSTLQIISPLLRLNRYIFGLSCCQHKMAKKRV